MKLHFAALLAAVALSSVTLAPTLAATATKAPAATTAMNAKPAMAKTAKVDAKRFKTEAAAAASCPTDTVVWANTKSKIFHLKGTATYGKGKNGTYMCQLDATAEHFKGTKKPEKMMAAAAATPAKSK